MLIHHEIKPQGERVDCSTEEAIAANEANRGLARRNDLSEEYGRGHRSGKVHWEICT